MAHAGIVVTAGCADLLGADWDKYRQDNGYGMVCGDGILVGDEDCDDNNFNDGDGCSASCAVESGWSCEGSPSSCTDVDECAAGTDDCDANATCANTPGSFTCACNGGYSGDGMSCAPIVVGHVVGGVVHSCASLNDGKVKCWGENGNGRLGLGDNVARGDGPNQMGNNLPAVDLGTGMTAKQIVAGFGHTCALLNDGIVKCWGGNNSGSLGLGDTLARGDGPNEMGNNLPAIELGTDLTAKQLVAGLDHTCVLLNDGIVKCWGENDSGRLGLGDNLDRGDDPNEMGNNLPAVDLGTDLMAQGLAAGGSHTCAILNNGSVKCWGRNGFGQLGVGDKLDRGDAANEMGDNLPLTDLGAGMTAKQIVAGWGHTCALLSNDRIKCWGYNNWGQLGVGDKLDRGDGANEMGDNLPLLDLGVGMTAKQLVAGLGHTCAILNNGSIKCWGWNGAGSLGLGDTSDRGDGPREMSNDLPSVSLGAGVTAQDLAAGGGHVCALLNNGSIKCWGWNAGGQLGLGDTFDRGDGPNEMGDMLSMVRLF